MSTITKKKKKKVVHQQPEEEDLQMRTIEDKYQVGQQIGKGAAGTVYKALDIRTATFVALKEIPAWNVKEIESIRAEVSLLQSLRHPNIVKYLDTVRTKDKLIIVTEYVENGSLYNVVKKFGNLQESLAQIYVVQVCKYASFVAIICFLSDLDFKWTYLST